MRLQIRSDYSRPGDLSELAEELRERGYEVSLCRQEQGDYNYNRRSNMHEEWVTVKIDDNLSLQVLIHCALGATEEEKQKLAWAVSQEWLKSGEIDNQDMVW